MHDLMRTLANTISSEPIRLALLARLDSTKGLTMDQKRRLDAARREAPTPYREIINTVMSYREMQDESRIP